MAAVWVTALATEIRSTASCLRNSLTGSGGIEALIGPEDGSGFGAGEDGGSRAIVRLAA